MKAYFVERFGTWKNLKLREKEEPELKEDQAKIRVSFIGLNFADLMQREGVYPRTPKPPFIPGLEASGVVEEAGKNLDKNLIGKRVISFPIFGSHSEFVFTDKFIEIPEDMSLEQAAALGVQGLTAYYSVIKLGSPVEGENLLITASSGGVGSLLIPLGKYLKLNVFGLCGSKEKVEFSLKRGADFVINYNEKGWYKNLKDLKFDIIIDSVGGKVMGKIFNLLDQGGRYILYGFSSSSSRKFSLIKAFFQFLKFPIIHPFFLISKNRTVSGFNLSLIDNVQSLRNPIENVFDLWKKGVLKPHIFKTYKFEELPFAHRDMQERKTLGKIIIKMSS